VNSSRISTWTRAGSSSSNKQHGARSDTQLHSLYLQFSRSIRLYLQKRHWSERISMFENARSDRSRQLERFVVFLKFWWNQVPRISRQISLSCKQVTQRPSTVSGLAIDTIENGPANVSVEFGKGGKHRRMFSQFSIGFNNSKTSCRRFLFSITNTTIAAEITHHFRRVTCYMFLILGSWIVFFCSFFETPYSCPTFSRWFFKTHPMLTREWSHFRFVFCRFHLLAEETDFIVGPEIEPRTYLGCENWEVWKSVIPTVLWKARSQDDMSLNDGRSSHVFSFWTCADLVFDPGRAKTMLVSITSNSMQFYASSFWSVC
jgi:hypothetical protein